MVKINKEIFTNIISALVIGAIPFTFNLYMKFNEMDRKVLELEENQIKYHFHYKNEDCLTVEIQDEYFCIEIWRDDDIK